MYVVVDNRQSVTESYASGFGREGLASVGFEPKDFLDWLNVCGCGDLLAADAFLLGDCEGLVGLPAVIRRRSTAPILALRSQRSLKSTLELFEAGVDDVVSVPVHIREVLARVAAIRRRNRVVTAASNASGALQVYFDGRDPEIDGISLPLPRRELRILEYMVAHQGRWITKTRLFNAIYGIFDSSFDESVIESHISKLRKKLRAQLGYDPILSKRFVGYCLDASVQGLTIMVDRADDIVEPATMQHDTAVHVDWGSNGTIAPPPSLLDRDMIRMAGSHIPGGASDAP
jgi:DNA-binding response OmpR family regulator